MQNKTRLELADYEAENLARLQKMFSRKWEFIFMQAEAQSKVDKKRDKLERKVLDSQERAFWDVHRPMVIFSFSLSFFLIGVFQPGCINTTEIDIKKACRMNKTLKYNKNLQISGKPLSTCDSSYKGSINFFKGQINLLKLRLERTNTKVSKVAEA